VSGDLRGRDTGFRTADYVQEPVASCLEPGAQAERDEHLRRFADIDTVERGVRDSNDDVRFPIERDGSPDDVPRPAELALPEPVSQHRDRRATRRVVTARQETAQHRSNAKRREVVAADPIAGGAAHLAAGRQIEPGLAAVREDARKDTLPVADLLPERVREDAAQLRSAHGDLDELLGVCDRQRPQHDGIDEAEDGRVRADAEA